MRWLLLFILCGFLGYSSCKKKDNCQDTVTYSYISFCLSQYMFNNNSRWVYQNMSDLTIDTIKVIDWTHEYLSYPTPQGNCYNYFEPEVITIQYQSTVNGDFKEELFANIISYSPNFADANFECDLVSYIDSLMVDSTMYYDVSLYLNNSEDVRAYYRKEGVGIIRWIEYNSVDSTVYDLIEHNVSLFEKPL